MLTFSTRSAKQSADTTETKIQTDTAYLLFFSNTGSTHREQKNEFSNHIFNTSFESFKAVAVYNILQVALEGNCITSLTELTMRRTEI